ncbi:MAG: hypothetical protein ACTSUV_03720 [Candidatus Ranarchaeia archaeon]
MDLLKPDWVNKPWMYKLPKSSEDIISWSKDWVSFLLKWCEYENRHIITIPDIVLSESFKTTKANFSPTEVKRVIEQLISQELAEWWDRERTILRVYWRAIDQWVDILYNWALEGGGLTLDPYKLINSDQNFSSLPRNDINKLIELLVKSKRAEWIDKKKLIIRVKI